MVVILVDRLLRVPRREVVHVCFVLVVRCLVHWHLVATVVVGMQRAIPLFENFRNVISNSSFRHVGLFGEDRCAKPLHGESDMTIYFVSVSKGVLNFYTLYKDVSST